MFYINIEEKSEPEISDSKLGGLPYYTKGEKYPEDESGEKLYLLVQINFEKEKTDSPLPSNSILQFFIWYNNDYLVGTRTKQKNLRIIYHDKIENQWLKNIFKNLKYLQIVIMKNFLFIAENKIN